MKSYLPERSRRRVLGVLALLGAFSASGEGAAWDGGAELRRLVDAAVRVAELEPGRPGGWRRRLGWAALLPRVSGRVSQMFASGQYWDLQTSQPAVDTNNRLALRWEVRATWDLSRLVFDTRELRVATTADRLAKVRRALTERVIGLYFERRRLLYAQPIVDGQAKRARLIKLRQVTALLDELTGGAMQRRRRR